MYEALTGRVPFDGDTFNELMFKIVLSEPPPLTDVVPEIDPKFASIVNTAMARELGERYSSADELRSVLEAYVAGRSIPAPPAGAAAAAPAAAEAAAPAGAAAGTVQTGDSWANTNAEMAVPKKSAVPVVAAIAGVLVLVGGAFGAYALVGGSGDAPEEASAAASAEVAHEPEVPEPAVKPVEPEPEPEPKAEPEPEPEASAEPEADEEPEPAPVKRAVAAPRPKAAPAPKPKAAPAPKPAPPPPKKKPVRKDFGY
jgi:hypothetical protein